MTTRSVLGEVAAERTRQDAQWGGAARDDTVPVPTFVQLIADYAAWARVKAREGSTVEARQRLVQVAALAVAAVESLDRRASGPGATTEGNESLKWE